MKFPFPDFSPHRSLLRACGLKDKDFSKPFIGIANSYSEIVPGHRHLRDLVEYIKKGIKDAGAIPFEFNTIAICDGIAMGHLGMRYSLPSRELISFSIESVALAHKFDGLVALGSCDKIVPGMWIAGARLNLPFIFVAGGAMEPGKLGKKDIDLITVFEALGKFKIGKISKKKLKEIECKACPGSGSCAGLFTANTLSCLSEILGISLPQNGTALALSKKRKKIAYESGRKIVELVKKRIKFSDIVTKESIDNAFILDLAMGGSTNTILHLLSLAKELGIKYSLERINKLAENTPYICKISPSDPKYHIKDLDIEGGVFAILKELFDLSILNLKCNTVLGKRIGELIKLMNSKDSKKKVIKSVKNPYLKNGALKILFGNLAPKGAVIKSGAVDKNCFYFKGKAKVFNSEDEANKYISSKKIKKGEVIVIRYEGMIGGPGMPEMLGPTSLIVGMNLDKKVALITDGRFSGGTRGICVGHIAPEAALKGPIAGLQDGDLIEINLYKNSINVLISEKELKKRLKKVKFEYKIKKGWLYYYAKIFRS